MNFMRMARYNRVVMAIALVCASGLVAAGCKGGSDKDIFLNGGNNGSTATNGALSASIPNALVNGANPNIAQNNGEYTFTLTASENNNSLNLTDAANSVSWSTDNSLLELTVNADKSAKVRSKGTVSSNPVRVAAVVARNGLSVTVTAFVTIGSTGSGGGNTGNLNIEVVVNNNVVTNLTVSLNSTSSIMQVRANGTTLNSGQFNVRSRVPGTTNDSALTNQPLFSNNTDFTVQAFGNSGQADLFVDVHNFNGQTGSRTLSNFFTIGSGGGGGSGTGTSQVAGPTFTGGAITNGNMTVGVGVSNQLNITATRDGVNVDDENLVNFFYQQIADCLNGNGAVDADGKVMMAKPNVTIQVGFWGKGNRHASSDAQEGAADAFMSPTVTITSNDTVTNAIVILTLPSVMAGMDFPVVVWNTKTKAKMGPGSGLNQPVTSDTSVATIEQRGNEYWCRAKKAGFFTITVPTFDGMTAQPFKVRVTTAFPQAQPDGSNFIIDTHENFGLGFPNPNNGNETWLPKCVNVSRLDLIMNGSNMVGSIYNLLFVTGQSLDGTTPASAIEIFDDPDTGQRWATFREVVNGISGSFNYTSHQYAQLVRTPIQSGDLQSTSQSRFPKDKQWSRFRGVNQDNFCVIVQVGGSLAGTGLKDTTVRQDPSR